MSARGSEFVAPDYRARLYDWCDQAQDALAPTLDGPGSMYVAGLLRMVREAVRHGSIQMHVKMARAVGLAPDA